MGQTVRDVYNQVWDLSLRQVGVEVERHIKGPKAIRQIENRIIDPCTKQIFWFTDSVMGQIRERIEGRTRIRRRSGL